MFGCLGNEVITSINDEVFLFIQLYMCVSAVASVDMTANVLCFTASVCVSVDVPVNGFCCAGVRMCVCVWCFNMFCCITVCTS